LYLSCLMKKTFLLILLNLVFLILDLSAQDSINWELPFKKCREINFENSDAQLIASDNEQTIFISKDKGKISSINVQRGQEVWQTNLGGIILPKAVVDLNSLYLVTKAESDSDVESYFLWSINTTNGVTNWKVRAKNRSYLSDYKNLKTVIVLNEDGSIAIFDKKTGKIIWSVDYKIKVSKFFIFSESRVYRLFQNQLDLISLTNGTVVFSIDLKTPLTSIYSSNDKMLLSGDASGNLIFSDLVSGKIKWQTKVGGYISFIDETSRGFLVSSYDNFLYLFSTNNGKLIWKKRVNGRITEEPLLTTKYAVISSIGDGNTNIIDLKSGKSVNQIITTNGNNFVNIPFLTKKFLILQTLGGVSFYSSVCVD
jgi:outer membrane protein assembly factor BamB